MCYHCEMPTSDQFLSLLTKEQQEQLAAVRAQLVQPSQECSNLEHKLPREVEVEPG